MRVKVVLHYLGLMIAAIGFAMLLPLGFSLFYKESDYLAFIVSMIISIGTGLLLWKYTRIGKGRLQRREAIAIVAFGWIFASAFGALPYVLSGALPNFINAYFETMSGFTTTGATVFDPVINAIESQPHGILLWRGFTQWLGGMGIITLFVAIFPILGIGAAHMVEAEVPGPQAEKLTAHIRDTAKILWFLYLGFTVLEVTLLVIAKLPFFDALTVTFATMPTGGFTPTTDSIGAYNSVFVDVTVIFFMVVAGGNFALYYFSLWKRQFGRLWHNSEFKLYVALLVGASLFIALGLVTKMDFFISDALRYASFQVASIMTTTGFVTANYDTWPEFTKTLLLLLMIVGASAGSTGGAIKVIRLLVLFKYAYRRIVLAFNPRRIIPLKIGGIALSESAVSGIIGMSVLYIAILLIGYLIMSAVGRGMGIDQITSLASVAATLGNVGPGLGLVGPAANYLWIPPLGKIVLTICMLVGRLEIFTVLVLVAPSFWKWR